SAHGGRVLALVGHGAQQTQRLGPRRDSEEANMLKKQWIGVYVSVLLAAAGAAQARPHPHPGPKSGEVHGTISALTAATATTPATVAISSGATTVTVNVTSSTRIEVNDHDATFADLRTGDR